MCVFDVIHIGATGRGPLRHRCLALERRRQHLLSGESAVSWNANLTWCAFQLGGYRDLLLVVPTLFVIGQPADSRDCGSLYDLAASTTLCYRCAVVKMHNLASIVRTARMCAWHLSRLRLSRGLIKKK